MTLLDPTPDTSTTDLAARAGETRHRSLGMLDLRATHDHIDPQEIANMSHLTEGNTSLCHAPWARIHSEEQGFDSRACVQGDVAFDRRTRIVQWGVNMRDRARKTQ